MPPSAIELQARARFHDARAAVIDLRAPAAQFLSERHRHGVHQVRAAGLHDVADVGDAAADDRAQIRQRRQQMLLDREQRAQVDRGRE